MAYLTALAISTGVVCGLWGLLSSATTLGLISFAGFAGCTSYFACPNLSGIKKVPKILAVNLTGVIYALMALKVTEITGSETVSVLMTGFISFLMVFQAKIIPYLDFMPGAFMGCFTTFATGGDIWTIPSILLGYFVGIGCDYGGDWLYQKLKNK